jgi:hypothetical protein
MTSHVNSPVRPPRKFILLMTAACVFSRHTYIAHCGSGTATNTEACSYSMEIRNTGRATIHGTACILRQSIQSAGMRVKDTTETCVSLCAFYRSAFLHFRQIYIYTYIYFHVGWSAACKSVPVYDAGHRDSNTSDLLAAHFMQDWGNWPSVLTSAIGV